MSDIADMFRRSPFDPIRVHMDKVMECVGHTKPMFERVRANDPEGLQDLARVVFKAEHQADLVKDEIRQTIPKSFFLPVYRGDLLGYLAVQDSMADTVEDLAVMLTLKHLNLPDQIADQVNEYLDKILWTCEKANEVSKALGELAEAGFTSDHIDRVLEMVATTEKAEWEADRKQYEVSKALFSLEGQLAATDIFLWFRVFGLLGELANHAEKVADRVRRMLAR
jgi:predicted phosphate transport protein (TIGR00153 family)